MTDSHPSSTSAKILRHRPGTTQFQTVPKQGGTYAVAPDVIGLKTQIVNSYFIGLPGSKNWVLVDAGMHGQAARFRALAEEHFGPGVPPRAIVLTHGHFDHVGSLEALLETWDVPVYAHTLELPYLTGAASYPPPDPTAGGGFMAWSSFLYPKKPLDLGRRVQALPEDGSIPVLPGWRWIHTPGHSRGHVSLFRDEDRLLIAGDAFVTIKAESLLANITLTPTLHRPPAYFTPDWPSAKLSIQKLAELDPFIAATGHGIPLYGPKMQEELRRLAYEFERLGLPATGRYREIPVSYDSQSGLTRLPPLPVEPYLRAGGVLLLFVLAILGIQALRDEE